MMTWAETVAMLQNDERYSSLVRDSFLDEPLLVAATRFAGCEEWQEVRKMFGCGPGEALDIGAGRGIASYALAKDGWHVVALEPDPSDVSGAGAIRRLAETTALSIDVVGASAEALPFESRRFDLVYGRQVFHHIPDISTACLEAFRVLKPGGCLAVVREHVISRVEDLPAFLAGHPIHRICGGEHARLLSEYRKAIQAAGFKIEITLGSLDSMINVAPGTHCAWRDECLSPVFRLLGWRAGLWLTSEDHVTGKWLWPLLTKLATRRDHRPGRLYSFIARKPCR